MFPRWAVSPEPPGIMSGSGFSGKGSGIGSAAVSRMQRATGATLSTTWPVMSLSPVCMAFFNRTSTGESPQASASLSIWDSCAKQA